VSKTYNTYIDTGVRCTFYTEKISLKMFKCINMSVIIIIFLYMEKSTVFFHSSLYFNSTIILVCGQKEARALVSAYVYVFFSEFFCFCLCSYSAYCTSLCLSTCPWSCSMICLWCVWNVMSMVLCSTTCRWLCSASDYDHAGDVLYLSDVLHFSSIMF
jgi:hypothetical protein